MPIGNYTNSWDYYTQKKFEEDLERYLSKEEPEPECEEEDDDD